MIYAFWACKDINNFGDAITPYIINKLGYDVEFNWNYGVALDGSILGICKENHWIYGAGFMNITDSTVAKNIRYVRGNISRALLKSRGIDVTNIITHIPAFCLAEFIKDKTPTKDITYALHYIDYDDFGIDVCKPVETVVNEILEHKNIITSSLHVYIVARMYGRGVALIMTDKKIAGDGTKYVDAFSCWGEKPIYPLDINDKKNISMELKRTFNNSIKFDNKKYLLDLNEYLIINNK